MIKQRFSFLAVLVLAALVLLGCAGIDTVRDSAVSTSVAAAVAAQPVATTQTVVISNTVVVSVTNPTIEDPAEEEYATLSEEELIALIDQTVEEAVAETTAYVESTNAATVDGEVTAEEVETIELYVYGAQEAVALAEEMLAAYDDLYGAYASQAVDELVAIEEELAEISDNTAAMMELLAEINATLAAGLTLAEETVSQLETAAAAAQEKVVHLQNQAEAWVETALQAAGQRPVTWENIQPQKIAAGRDEAIRQAMTYLEAVNSALLDNAISAVELQQIAQLGANASASLNLQGGAGLQLAAGSIDAITEALALGDLSQAEVRLNNLSSQLTSLPVGGLPADGNIGGSNFGVGRGK